MGQRFFCLGSCVCCSLTVRGRPLPVCGFACPSRKPVPVFAGRPACGGPAPSHESWRRQRPVFFGESARCPGNSRLRDRCCLAAYDCCRHVVSGAIVERAERSVALMSQGSVLRFRARAIKAGPEMRCRRFGQRDAQISKGGNFPGKIILAGKGCSPGKAVAQERQFRRGNSGEAIQDRQFWKGWQFSFCFQTISHLFRAIDGRCRSCFAARGSRMPREFRKGVSQGSFATEFPRGSMGGARRVSPA